MSQSLGFVSSSGVVLDDEAEDVAPQTRHFTNATGPGGGCSTCVMIMGGRRRLIHKSLPHRP